MAAIFRAQFSPWQKLGWVAKLGAVRSFRDWGIQNLSNRKPWGLKETPREKHLNIASRWMPGININFYFCKCSHCFIDFISPHLWVCNVFKLHSGLLLMMMVSAWAGSVFVAQLPGARVKSPSDVIPPWVLKDFQDFPLNIWLRLIILEHAGKSQQEEKFRNHREACSESCG